MFVQTGSNSPTEPMILGSSPSSPNSPMSGSGSQFLPGFLTGTTTPCTPPSTARLWGVGSPATTSLSYPVTGIHSNDGSSPYSKTTRNVAQQRPRDKPGVPPVQGLFEKISSPAISSPYQSTTVQDRLNMTEMAPSPGLQPVHVSGILTPNRNLNRLSDRLFASPAQIDPFYTQGESLTANTQLDETWVTVFGFPPTAASYILQQFSHCGTILDHKVATMGNWMHIHYETKLQAKKAIGKNGKIFGDSIMVGVTQCIDKNVMSSCSKENVSLSANFSTSFDSPVSSNTSRGPRPLSQAYKTAISTHKVTPQSRTPQKTNTIVSKAMEYIFSW